MMRILTYNIAGNRGRSRVNHLGEIAEVILSCGADVVGLQEVVHHERDPRPPEEVLAELTGMHAVYVPAHHAKRHTLGNAVLCVRPILETVTHELPHTFPERRILLEAETTTADGLPVTIFCTHLVHMARAAARLRLAQASTISKRMAECWRPHVLVGDLNAGPNAGELHPVRRVAVHHEGERKHHAGLRSWPTRRPWLLYDHVWPGPGWEVEEIRSLDARASDHRPVLAQLGWKGAPRFNIMPDEPYLHRAAAAPAESAP